MSEKGLIINSENGNEDLEIKRYCVAVIFTRPMMIDPETKLETLEIRQQMMVCESTDPDGAEWMAKRYFSGDEQIPKEYVFNQALAMEIK